MKSRLRTLTVHGAEYGYSIKHRFERLQGQVDGSWHTTLTLYRMGFQNSWLKVHFHTADDYAQGNLLLQTSTDPTRPNLHTPGTVRELLDHAHALGWTGDHVSMEVEDGLPWLVDCGFEIGHLQLHDAQK